MSLRQAVICLDSESARLRPCIGLPMPAEDVENAFAPQPPAGRLGPRLLGDAPHQFPALLIGFAGYPVTYILFFRDWPDAASDPQELFRGDFVTFVLLDESHNPIAAFDSPCERGFGEQLRTRLDALPSWRPEGYDSAVRTFFASTVDIGELWLQHVPAVVGLTSEEDLREHRARLCWEGRGDLVAALEGSLREKQRRELLHRMLRASDSK